MTETEWLAGKNAYQMLLGCPEEIAGDRKWRLFACAVARRLWGRFHQEAIRRAVELAELVADGGAPGHQLKPACDAAHDSIRRPRGIRAAKAAANSANPYAVVAAILCAGHAGMTGLRREGVVSILREVFGNPFRAVPLDRGWLTPDAAALARSAYEGRALPGGELDPMRLAILADIIEEAGCWDAELLGHLRGPGPHVRGCWAVDLLLGEG